MMAANIKKKIFFLSKSLHATYFYKTHSAIIDWHLVYLFFKKIILSEKILSPHIYCKLRKGK